MKEPIENLTNDELMLLIRNNINSRKFNQAIREYLFQAYGYLFSTKVIVNAELARELALEMLVIVFGKIVQKPKEQQ